MNNLSFSEAEKTYIKFAKVIKPHGVSGGVKTAFLPGGTLTLSLVKEVFFQIGDKFIRYDLFEVRGNQFNPIMYFKNIINIDDAQFLQDKEIYISREYLLKNKIEIPLLLLEAFVLATVNEKLCSLGVLKRISKGTHYNYMEILSIRGKELSVPLTEDFIEDTNFLEMKIILKNPGGFFDNEV